MVQAYVRRRKCPAAAPEGYCPGSMFDNPYSSPEKWHLTLVDSVNQTQEAYQYDIFAVWVDDFGNLYYDNDSGCSCPSPFEDVSHIGELQRSRDLDDIERAAKKWAKEGGATMEVKHQIDLMVSKAGRMQRTRKEN